MPKIIPIKQITSWSFSRYSTYRACPLKAKLAFIDKIKEPGNEAMERGNKIHEMAEQYIKGLIRTLPKELSLFKDEFKKLKAIYKKVTSGTVVEDTWAFTKDWDRSRWNDWVNCVVRIKLDCAHLENESTMIITDWKTGKFRAEMNEEYIEQLELYALAALILHPHIDVVKPRLVYLDLGIVYPPSDEPIVFSQLDVPRLKKLWAKRTRAMLNDTKFAPKPNDKCKWCHFRASNKANGGGQCKF